MKDIRTALLRWSLSLVLGTSAAALVVRSHRAPLMALGIAETAGAVLLLLPRTRTAGAGLLLLSLLLASGFHALSGERPPAAFLVYAAAIVLVAAP
jgi:hypothetical protein